jgi:hypothetical protein
MDPSTTPIAAGANHGNAAVVPVNQPVIIVWFPEAVIGPAEGEIEPPHANWRVVVADGPRVGLTVVVAREVNHGSMFQEGDIVDDGGLQGSFHVFFLVNDAPGDELGKAAGHQLRYGAVAAKSKGKSKITVHSFHLYQSCQDGS